MKKSMKSSRSLLVQYIDASAIAGALGVARSGVFNLARQGKFPAGVKIGNSRRWNIDEVRAWIDSLKDNPND